MKTFRMQNLYKTVIRNWGPGTGTRHGDIQAQSKRGQGARESRKTPAKTLKSVAWSRVAMKMLQTVQKHMKNQHFSIRTPTALKRQWIINIFDPDPPKSYVQDRSWNFQDRSWIFLDRSWVFQDRSWIFQDRSWIFQDGSWILQDRSCIFQDRS